MPSSQLFRRALLSKMRVVSPTSGSPSAPADSPADGKQKRPSCSTANKFSKERLERLAEQKREQVRAPASPAPPAIAPATFTSNKSHIIRSVSKLFGRNRTETESEPARGRSRQRRVVSGGSLDDSQRGRARSLLRGSKMSTKMATPREGVKRAAGYKPVRSRALLGPPLAAHRFPSAATGSSAASLSLVPAPKVKRGPSPLSQSSWTSPLETTPRTPPVPVGMPPASLTAADVGLEEQLDTPMVDLLLPLPPLMTRSLSSSTESSDEGSLPQTPADEDVIMVEVFGAHTYDSDNEPEPEDKTVKSIPPPVNEYADIRPGALVASDSELERQLWADMNEILGHEDELAKFCGPYAEPVVPTLADLPAGVPPPIIAQDIAFPFASNGQLAKATPDVVITPATPQLPVASSMDALWEELFGPESQVWKERSL